MYTHTRARARIPSLVSMQDQAHTKMRGRDQAVSDAENLLRRAQFKEALKLIDTGLQCYPDDLQLTQLRTRITDTAAKYTPIFEEARALMEQGHLGAARRQLSAATALCARSDGVEECEAELAKKKNRRDMMSRTAIQCADAAEFASAISNIDLALKMFPQDPILEDRRQDIMRKKEHFPSRVAKAEQLVLEGKFSAAIAAANSALELCKKAAPALDALSDAKQKARFFPPLESAAKCLRSNGNDFDGTKNKINEALALCPQSQSMLNMLHEIEKANRLFKAVLTRHSFDKLKVGGTVFVLLKSHMPPTVFLASVSQLNFMRQTISVAFPDLKGIEHEFDVKEFAQLVKQQNHPAPATASCPTIPYPPATPATPAATNPPTPATAILPVPASTATRPFASATTSPTGIQSAAASADGAHELEVSPFASRVMGECA